MNDKTIKDNCTPAQACGAYIELQQGTVDKKITELAQRTPTGDEYFSVAFGNENFKVKVSDIVAAGGTSGFSGVSSFSGFSGAGTSGFSGFSGLTIVGTSGFSGRSGFSGAGQSGASGFSGIGVQGVSGFSGYSGLGFSGFSGFSGAGTSGFSGQQGQSGFSGRLTVAGLGYVARINDPLNQYATRAFAIEPPLEIINPQGVAGNTVIYYDETCAVNSYFSFPELSTANTNVSYITGLIITLEEVFQTQNILTTRGSSGSSIQSYFTGLTYYQIDANVTINMFPALVGATFVLAFGDDNVALLETVFTVPTNALDGYQQTISLSGLVKIDNQKEYTLKMYMPVGATAVSFAAAPKSYLTVKAIIK